MHTYSFNIFPKGPKNNIAFQASVRNVVTILRQFVQFFRIFFLVFSELFKLLQIHYFYRFQFSTRKLFSTLDIAVL